MFPVSAWVSSGYSGFLPQSKDMQVGPKLLVGMCVSECCVCPAIDWWPVQGVFLPLTQCTLG
uniref:Uncharacterized protein n=1 Tax=Anguilla anguilla TaxID=7936 RepID=A0A0E9XF19_ANGAN